MKKMFIGAMMLSLSLSAFGNETASNLFSKRGEDKNNALKAADIVRDLAKSASGVEKASLKSREAEYVYFYGQRISGKDAKKKIHARGYDAAEVAISILGTNGGKDAKEESLKTPLAKAHYFYAINLGKWGEANGVLSSLSKWPQLKGHLDIIDRLDASVEDYGSYRTRARALHKLPFGSNADAEKLLEDASEKTLSDMIELSKNSTTVLFLLDILAENDKTSRFCDVYDLFTELSEFTDEELLEYNENKLPEVKTDLELFLNNEDFENDVEKYYRRNC